MFENDLHWDVDIKTIFPVLFWFFFNPIKSGKACKISTKSKLLVSPDF